MWKSEAKGRQPWRLFIAASILLVTISLYFAGLYGRQTAINALLEQGRTDASLKVALLRAVLERPRVLPLVLVEDQQVLAALKNNSSETIDNLDHKLEGLVAGTNASVLYVIATDGVAIASSNWREPLSFVGNDYSFREYFSRAASEGTAEHFAMGNVSKRPGLYISRRAIIDNKMVGVVVVKTEFDQLESDWSSAGRPAYVTDSNGVVIITSVPSWRFHTTSRLPPEQSSAIRQSLQFGDAPLAPLPISKPRTLGPDAEIVSATLPDAPAAGYLHLRTAVPSTSWKFEYLIPIDAAVEAAVRETRLVVIVVLVPLLAIVALILRRRQVNSQRRSAELAAREELERRVSERTIDLSKARDQLQEEIADHRSTESKLQIVQQELVQANRLAILGQVAAGVAHEINQPVATIRAYADNAKVFLDRGQKEPADENLTEIAALTERIGTITEELKAFGRKGRTPPEAVGLRGAIEGAVVLLKSRFAGRLEALKITLPSPELTVLGNRVRLEQVLINLFQNALEALEGHPNAKVDVSVEEEADDILIRIADNGPGIPTAIRDQLFTPFNTSKEKGLGLGLVISKDIITDYGGNIGVVSDERGTTFTIHLKKVQS